ncbi:hypothetical protein NXH64_04880 [Butyrivibrio fibrisolvens]|uniref:hypothetical protein n=1 Tax=Pseudobutyrivibrio ruminis TaxID=46206 RepID=UPI0003FEB15A|nr:hypothetical protein [Pseudobutyrivibrio ruminis]MDC7278834.1 hypothetical protein [Butyrivibrio fibrisolvens]
MLKKIKYSLLYLILFIPICFSIFYSVPASDDFGNAIRTDKTSTFIQAVVYAYQLWATWCGRWVNTFLAKLLNPLNSHVHLGHNYGLFMIVVFIVTTVVIIFGLKVCVERVLGKESKYVSLVTFLIMTIFLSTNYYSECYNWFNGAMVYSVPMSFVVLAVAAMIKYAESGYKSTLHYVLIIVFGFFAATIEYCDVALGITYVYFIYYCDLEERLKEEPRKKIKNIAPLLVYIILGVSSVFAPGNKIRQGYYELDLSISKSFIQYIKDIVIRIQDLIVDHPLAVLIFTILIFIGILSNSEHEQVKRIPETIILFIIIITGAIYPYIYARAFDTTYLDIRMEYIFDFCLHVSLGVLCVMLGKYLSYRFKFEFDSKNKLMVITALILFAYVSIIQNYAYLNIVQIDILRNRGIITESFNYWDDVLKEIEASTEDDVIIERDYVPEWSRYFLSVGIQNGEVFDVSSDKVYDEERIMPNVYYGKKSIQMKIAE